MKRLLSVLLCLMLLTAVSLPAFAEEHMTVSFGVPGNAYSLFVLRPGTTEITQPNILFMDQLTANEQGKISLVFPGFEEGTVFLGGVFRDAAASPRRIGTIPMSGTEEKPMNMPAMLTKIEDSAFEGGSFTHVYLGESVTTIGARAFADCAELLYIYIPDSVESIAEDAFSQSGSVVIGCHEGSYAAQYAAERGIDWRTVA